MPFRRVSISDRAPMEPRVTTPEPGSRALIFLGDPAGPHTELAGTPAAMRLLAKAA